MATIKRHRPAYFSGFDDEKSEFNSLTELFNIEWVDNFRKLPNNRVNTNFHRYSVSKSVSSNGYVLIAEYDNGFEWWVIGFTDDDKIINELPEWEAKYKD
jgi:hypothetical protein